MTFQKREREREGEGRGRERENKIKDKLQLWWKFQLISIWEFMMIPLHTTTANEICCGNKSNHLDSIFGCLIERLALGISYLFYNLFKPCWILDGPRIKRPNMTSWSSKHRSFGMSFFRRSDCLKLTHLPFFDQSKTRELVDGCMELFRCTKVLLKRSESGGGGRESLCSYTLQLKPLWRGQKSSPPKKIH